MDMLLRGILARVQRDQKVILCHYVWMANHAHIIIVVQDKKACTAFYSEVQKQITEAIKRLTGLDFLSLWKPNSASVIPIHDIETACHRIAYLYANPATANLVDTIGDYPGVSSWGEFAAEMAEGGGASKITQDNPTLENPANNHKPSAALNSTHTRNCPWVRLPFIEQLPQPALTRSEDLALSKEWETKAKDSHTLILNPNAWMKTFKIKTQDQVEEINKQIGKYLTGLEESARQKRAKGKKRIMGKKALRAQPLNLTYRPKKPTRRIFVYSVDPKLRVYLIEKYEEFCELCRKCYLRWKMRDYSVRWPKGALLPPAPHFSNDFDEGVGAVY